MGGLTKFLPTGHWGNITHLPVSILRGWSEQQSLERALFYENMENETDIFLKWERISNAIKYTRKINVYTVAFATFSSKWILNDTIKSANVINGHVFLSEPPWFSGIMLFNVHTTNMSENSEFWPQISK